MDLSNRRIIEWWSCRSVDSLNCGMIELSNLQIVEWRSWWFCRIVESSNGGVFELSSDGMMELLNRRIAEVSHRQNGRMAELVEFSERRIVENWNDGVGGVVESSNGVMVG